MTLITSTPKIQKGWLVIINLNVLKIQSHFLRTAEELAEKFDVLLMGDMFFDENVSGSSQWLST